MLGNVESLDMENRDPEDMNSFLKVLLNIQSFSFVLLNVQLKLSDSRNIFQAFFSPTLPVFT